MWGESPPFVWLPSRLGQSCIAVRGGSGRIFHVLYISVKGCLAIRVEVKPVPHPYSLLPLLFINHLPVLSWLGNLSTLHANYSVLTDGKNPSALQSWTCWLIRHCYIHCAWLFFFWSNYKWSRSVLSSVALNLDVPSSTPALSTADGPTTIHSLG